MQPISTDHLRNVMIERLQLRPSASSSTHDIQSNGTSSIPLHASRRFLMAFFNCEYCCLLLHANDFNTQYRKYQNVCLYILYQQTLYWMLSDEMLTGCNLQAMQDAARCQYEKLGQKEFFTLVKTKLTEVSRFASHHSEHQVVFSCAKEKVVEFLDRLANKQSFPFAQDYNQLHIACIALLATLQLWMHRGDEREPEKKVYAEFCTLLFAALHAPGHHAHALFLYRIQTKYSVDQLQHHEEVFKLAVEFLQRLSKHVKQLSLLLDSNPNSLNNKTFFKCSELLASHLASRNHFLDESRTVFASAMAFSRALPSFHKPCAPTSLVARIGFREVIAAARPNHTAVGSIAHVTGVSATHAAEDGQASLLHSSETLSASNACMDQDQNAYEPHDAPAGSMLASREKATSIHQHHSGCETTDALLADKAQTNGTLAHGETFERGALEQHGAASSSDPIDIESIRFAAPLATDRQTVLASDRGRKGKEKVTVSLLNDDAEATTCEHARDVIVLSDGDDELPVLNVKRPRRETIVLSDDNDAQLRCPQKRFRETVVVSDSDDEDGLHSLQQRTMRVSTAQENTHGKTPSVSAAASSSSDGHHHAQRSSNVVIDVDACGAPLLPSTDKLIQINTLLQQAIAATDKLMQYNILLQLQQAIAVEAKPGLSILSGGLTQSYPATDTLLKSASVNVQVPRSVCTSATCLSCEDNSIGEWINDILPGSATWSADTTSKYTGSFDSEPCQSDHAVVYPVSGSTTHPSASSTGSHASGKSVSKNRSRDTVSGVLPSLRIQPGAIPDPDELDSLPLCVHDVPTIALFYPPFDSGGEHKTPDPSFHREKTFLALSIKDVREAYGHYYSVSTPIFNIKQIDKDLNSIGEVDERACSEWHAKEMIRFVAPAFTPPLETTGGDVHTEIHNAVARAVVLPWRTETQRTMNSLIDFAKRIRVTGDDIPGYDELERGCHLKISEDKTRNPAKRSRPSKSPKGKEHAFDRVHFKLRSVSQGYVPISADSWQGEAERDAKRQEVSASSPASAKRRGKQRGGCLFIASSVAENRASTSDSVGGASSSDVGCQSVLDSGEYRVCSSHPVPEPLGTSKGKGKAAVVSSTPAANHQTVSYGGNTKAAVTSSHVGTSWSLFTCAHDSESSLTPSNRPVQTADEEVTNSSALSESSAVDQIPNAEVTKSATSSESHAVDQTPNAEVTNSPARFESHAAQREGSVLPRTSDLSESDAMSKSAMTEAPDVERMLKRFFDIDNASYLDSYDPSELRKRLIRVVTSNVSGIPSGGEECLSDATRLLSRKLGVLNRGGKNHASKVVLPQTDRFTEQDLYNAWPKVNPFLAKTASFKPTALSYERINIYYEAGTGKNVRSSAVDQGGPTRQWVHAMSYQLLPIAMKKVQSDAYVTQDVVQASPSSCHQGTASQLENALLGNDGQEHAIHQEESASSASEAQVHPAFFDAHFAFSEPKQDKYHFEHVIATWMVLLLSHFKAESVAVEYAIHDFYLPSSIQGWEFYVFASLSNMTSMHTTYGNKEIGMTPAEAMTFELFCMLRRLDAASSDTFLNILSKDDYFEYQSEQDGWSQGVSKCFDQLHLKINGYLVRKIQALLGIRSRKDDELDVDYAKKWCEHVAKVHALVQAHFNHCKLSAIEQRASDIADIVKSKDPNRSSRVKESFLHHVTHTLSASSLSYLVSVKPEIIGVDEVMELLISDQEETADGVAWQVPSEILSSIQSYVSGSTNQRSLFLNFCTANAYYRKSSPKIHIAYDDSPEKAGRLPLAHSCVPMITFYKLSMFSTGDAPGCALSQREQYTHKLASAIEFSGNTFGTE